MKKYSIGPLCFSIALLLSLCLSFACGGGGGGDDGGGSPADVWISGDRSCLPGERIVLTVRTGKSCDVFQFMLESDGGEKTVWQDDPAFALYLDDAGSFNFMGHLMCDGERFSSSWFQVKNNAADYVLISSESDLAANVPTGVVFQIDSGGVDHASITLNNVTNGQSYLMYDDGAAFNGDAVAGDGIYSCLLSLSLPEGVYSFQGAAGKRRTNFLNVYSIARPTDDVLEAEVDDVALAEQYVMDNAVGKTIQEFIDSFPSTLGGSEQISAIRKSDDYIAVLFNSGAYHLIEFTAEDQDQAPGTMLKNNLIDGHVIGSVLPQYAGRADARTIFDGEAYIKDYSGLLYSANYRNRHGRDAGERISGLLGADPDFSGNVTWLTDRDVTVDSMTRAHGQDWSDFGVIAIHAHGNSRVFQLGELVNDETDKKYAEQRQKNTVYTSTNGDATTTSPDGTITHVEESVYAIQTQFIADENEFNLNGSFFYAAACSGGLAMQHIIPSEYRRETTEIGSALFGFDATVTSPRVVDLAETLFNNLLNGNLLKDSFSSDWDGNENDGDDKVARPVVCGNNNLKLEVLNVVFSEDFESYPLDQPLATANWTIENSGSGTTYIKKPLVNEDQSVVFLDPDETSYSHIRKTFAQDVRQGTLDFYVRPNQATCTGVRLEGSLGDDYWDMLGPYAFVCDYYGTFGVYAYDVPSRSFVLAQSISPYQEYRITLNFDLDAGTYNLDVNGQQKLSNIPVQDIARAYYMRAGTFSDAESSANVYFDDFTYVDKSDASAPVAVRAPEDSYVSPYSDLYASPQ